MLATLDRMARPEKPKTKQVRMRLDMAKKLEIIGASKGLDLPDLFAFLFGPTIEKEYRLALNELAKLRDSKRAQAEE